MIFPIVRNPSIVINLLISIYEFIRNKDQPHSQRRSAQALFSEFGQVTSVRIIGDKYTGESKGFGSVEMANENQALEAIKRLTNAEFFGRQLVVSKASL